MTPGDRCCCSFWGLRNRGLETGHSYQWLPDISVISGVLSCPSVPDTLYPHPDLSSSHRTCISVCFSRPQKGSFYGLILTSCDCHADASRNGVCWRGFRLVSKSFLLSSPTSPFPYEPAALLSFTHSISSLACRNVLEDEKLERQIRNSLCLS